MGPDALVNTAKSESLSSALLVFTTVPWALCAVFYSGLHLTYPRDRRRAAQQAAAVEAAALLAAGESVELVAASPAPPVGSDGERGASVELVAAAPAPPNGDGGELGSRADVARGTNGSTSGVL